MTEVIMLNTIDKEHYEEVKKEMKKLGSPTIKAVWVEAWNAWVSLEGSHRLASAEELGLPVIIQAIEYSDKKVSEYDTDIDHNYTIAEIVDYGYQSYNDGAVVDVETIIK